MKKTAITATELRVQNADDEDEFIFRAVGIIGLMKDLIGQLLLGQHLANTGGKGNIKTQEIAALTQGFNFSGHALDEIQREFVIDCLNFYCAGLRGKKPEIHFKQHMQYSEDFSLAELDGLIVARKLRKASLDDNFRMLIKESRREREAAAVTGG